MQQRPVVTLLRPHRERQKEREAAQRHGRDPRRRLPRSRSHHRRRDDVNKRGRRNPQLRHPAPASAFARVQQLGAPEVRAGMGEFDGAGVERPVGMQFLQDQAAKFRELPFGGECGAGNREGVRARERDQKRLRLGKAGQFGPGLRDQAAIAAQRQRFRIGLQHPAHCGNGCGRKPPAVPVRAGRAYAARNAGPANTRPRRAAGPLRSKRALRRAGAAPGSAPPPPLPAPERSGAGRSGPSSPPSPWRQCAGARAVGACGIRPT